MSPARLSILAVVAALSVALLLALGRSDSERPPTTAASGVHAGAPPTRGLTVREEIGEVVLMRFDGTSVPRYVRRILRRRHASGVTLFADNAGSPRGLRTLTRQIQRAAGGEALIAADQEGGVARAFRWASPAGEPALATPPAAAGAARATAAALRAGGVNVNFAPVLDVANGAGSALRARAYPGNARQVAGLAAAAVRAYRSTGVAPTLKHFPGLGRATANTDAAPVTIAATRAELAGDLAPFRAAISARAPLVMVSHALYPAYDPHRIASQSRTLVQGLLRRRLGFRGVVATDSLEAHAVLKRSSVGAAAVASIDAGCDLLVLTGVASQKIVYPRLLAEARRSPAFRQRLRQAAARVLALKRSLGLRVPRPAARR